MIQARTWNRDRFRWIVATVATVLFTVNGRFNYGAASVPLAAVTTSTFTPTADAYVDSSAPTKNTGTSLQLRADGSPIVRSYLRFSITGLTAPVSSATLRLYPTSSLSAGFTAYQEANNTWGETTITYGNAPAPGGAINSSGAVTSGAWAGVDVTGYVTGNGTWSFVLATASSTALALASREAVNKPQLVIQTTTAAPTSTPTFTPASTPTNTPTRTSTSTATATATRTAAATSTATATSAAAPTDTPISTSTSTATATATSMPTSTPVLAPDPVIVAAGDIACDPASTSFMAGQGTDSKCRQLSTSNLILNLNPAAVLDLGDTQYYCGSLTAFMQSYDLSWGRVKPITHPVVGNHEYLTSGGTGCDDTNAGAAGYFQYFGAAAGNPTQGYYSYDVGAWHLIALNSNCSEAGGCSSVSPQGKWLQADLTAHPTVCTLAYWHIPLWSSGGRASPNTAQLTQILYTNNADVVLAGHDHTYERFAPQDYNGALDLARGIRAFVVGTGGANHTPFTTIAPNSEVRNDSTYGMLKIALHAASYDWQFVPEAGKTFSDSGMTACH